MVAMTVVAVVVVMTVMVAELSLATEATIGDSISETDIKHRFFAG